MNIKELRQFGITLSIVLFIFGLIHLLKQHLRVYPWFLISAAVCLLTGMFFPVVLKPIFFIFKRITAILAWFNTRLILILVFYLVATPIGVLMRIFGKDPLDKKIVKNSSTYWIKREKAGFTREDLDKQF